MSFKPGTRIKKVRTNQSTNNIPIGATGVATAMPHAPRGHNGDCGVRLDTPIDGFTQWIIVSQNWEPIVDDKGSWDKVEEITKWRPKVEVPA